jgi:putative serine protease PepD
MTPTSRSRLLGVAAVVAAGAGGAAATAALVDQSNDAAPSTVTVTTGGSRTTAAAVQTGTLSAGDIYRRTKQGVVEIKVRSSSGAGEGTGFVLDRQGDIVTNEHVVNDASSVTVDFADGRSASARVVGTDPSADVAVIRVSVPSSALAPLTFGDSGQVQVGDPVLAIGTPYGLAGTLTTGIISALDRSITSPSRYAISGTLQTDAAINPGNSGGPLLDDEGHVIGMNAQIESASDGNTGVGFAIASNTVRRVAQDLAAGKTPQHAYLGVSLTDASGGAGLGAVTPGGPADQAGLREGDVVTAIDGQAVEDADAAVGAVAAHAPGDSVKVTYERGGAARTATLKLGARPAAPAA